MATVTVYDSSSITLPSNGDTLNFEGGSADVTTGLDITSLLEGLDFINVTRNWHTNIGSPATSLRADLDFSASSRMRYNAGGGSMWYSPNGDNNLAHLIQCTGVGNLILNGTGTVTRLEHGRGNTTVGGSITMTNLDLAGGKVEQQAGGATAPTTVTISGGKFDSKRGLNAGGNLFLYGGEAVFDTTDAIPTITFTNGRLRLLRSGTITAFNVIGGDLRNVEISRAITITDTTIWASVPGMSAFLDNPLITFTNAPTRRIATMSEWQ